jgi:hypothetical protein
MSEDETTLFLTNYRVRRHLLRLHMSRLPSPALHCPHLSHNGVPQVNEIKRKLDNDELDTDMMCRSPSPPPTYDKMGTQPLSRPSGRLSGLNWRRSLPVLLCRPLLRNHHRLDTTLYAPR